MNKTISIAVLFLLISPLTYSQNTIDDHGLRLGEIFTGNNAVAIQTTETEGNPFFFDEFVTAVLVSGNQQTVPVKINIDLGGQSIIVSQDNKLISIQYTAVNEIRVTSPSKLTLKSGFATNGVDDLNKRSFFEVIHEGDVTFLKNTGVALQKDVSSYSNAVQQDVYMKYTAYYAVVDGKFKRIKMRKKNILKLFGDNKKAVDKYAKENKLDFKNDNHLVEIFNFASTL